MRARAEARAAEESYARVSQPRWEITPQKWGAAVVSSATALCPLADPASSITPADVGGAEVGEEGTPGARGEVKMIFFSGSFF